MYMKKLYCHTDLVFEGKLCAKNGKTYDIVDESHKYYDIINEEDNVHSFTKKKDEYGESYRLWFNLIEPKEEAKQTMKKFVLKVEQNGGEYHGFVTIKGYNLDKVEGYTVVVDGMEITFDECIVKVETKEVE